MNNTQALKTSSILERLPRARALGSLAATQVAEQILSAYAGPRRTVVLTVPAPRVEPEAVFAADRGPEAFFWDAGGCAVVGSGCVHRLRAAGPNRFRALRHQAARVSRGLVTADLGTGTSVRPRFYGGLAFDTGAADEEPWRAFGDGDFVLPRFLYRRTGDEATLTLAVRDDELAGRGDVHAFCEALEQQLDELASARPTPSAVARPVEHQAVDRALLTARIEELRHEIAAGSYRKVVTAGCGRWKFDTAVDPVPVLRRLRDPELVRFAFRRGASTFVGATPERLVRLEGRRLSTEALAGTSRPENGAAALLASAKDRHEHQLVVEAIRERLATWADLEVPSVPEVRALRHVLHLRTPIEGVLRIPFHVLELAETLHPTPAVGGLPSASALRWIAERELMPRGWYAGPVGFFDAQGDGELAVALRSALLAGREALVYAGAGIVADSDPEHEIREMELKRQTLKSALLVA